jgi:gliding motility-associated-like protein
MSVNHFLRILFIVAPVFSQAQYLSVQQRFMVAEKKGCTGLVVTITDTNLKPAEGICGPGVPCDITWGDASIEQITINTATHTYTAPGTYTLRILYQSAGFDEIQITVTPSLPPTFDIFTCGGNEVQVRVTDTNYDGYILNFNDGSPEVQVPKGTLAVSNHTFGFSGPKTISVRGKDVNADDNCINGDRGVLALPSLPAPFINELRVISNAQIDFNFTTLQNIQYRLEVATNNNTTFQNAQTVYNSTTATLNNLQTNTNFYCFRLGAFDPCNNTIAYSNVICSTNFTVAANNNQNTLAWTTNTTDVVSFTVLRDGIPYTTTNSNSFTDNTTSCQTEYCYRIVTHYTNGSSSSSTEKCVTAISTDMPTSINNATAIVTSNGLDISWQQDPGFVPVEYSIYRKEGSGNFQLVNKTSTSTYSDFTYTTESDFDYQINYIDICGNTSPLGIAISPIRLTGNVTNENYSELTWSTYTGWIDGVAEYIIEKYSAQGVLLQTFTVSSSTTSFTDTEVLPDQQIVHYVIKASPITPGLGQAVSNEIIIIKTPNIFYPTAFTPDNQGPAENELFRVFGQYIATFELQIFNRWGEMIFATTSIDAGWDGTYRGQNVQDGTYAFVARMTDLTGASFTRTGSVVLLRKK